MAKIIDKNPVRLKLNIDKKYPINITTMIRIEQIEANYNSILKKYMVKLKITYNNRTMIYKDVSTIKIVKNKLELIREQVQYSDFWKSEFRKLFKIRDKTLKRLSKYLIHGYYTLY